MDLANIDNNNPLLPEPSRLEDTTFLSVVFMMSLLTSLVLEIIQIGTSFYIEESCGVLQWGRDEGILDFW